jgi:hypothetical protein
MLAKTSALLSLMLLTVVPSSFAGPLRVTTWNLQSAPDAGTQVSPSATNQNHLQEAAATLKELDPDVLLLQGVRDWQMCSRLIQALKPANYNVLVCSAFGAPRPGSLSEPQVAILAKQKAYFSWSESWRAPETPASPGGFAFAALQVGNQRFGFFSVELGSPSAARASARAACIRQVLDQVNSVTNWVANRVQAFVIGSTLGPGLPASATSPDPALRLLDDAGFADAFLDTPAAQRITQPPAGRQPGVTADYIFTAPPGLAVAPRVLSVSGCEHYPVTCEVELDPARIAAAQKARAELALPAAPQPRVETPKPASAANSNPRAIVAPHASGVSPWVWLAIAFGIPVLVVSVWLVARRKPRRPPPMRAAHAPHGERTPAGPSAFTVILAPHSATGSTLEETVAPPAPQPIIHLETPGSAVTQSAAWQQRALAAERKAELANATLRAGLLPYLSKWLKQKLVRKLIADRAHLMETQEAATLKAMAVDERLGRIERQVQQQNQMYQRRIEELGRELLAAKEENRELIRARINQIKAEMEAARAKILSESDGPERQS